MELVRDPSIADDVDDCRGITLIMFQAATNGNHHIRLTELIEMTKSICDVITYSVPVTHGHSIEGILKLGVIQELIYGQRVIPIPKKLHYYRIWFDFDLNS